MNKKEFLSDNLVCPKCLNAIDAFSKNFCNNCAYKFKLIKGTPIFLDESSRYINKLSENNSTNPYSPKSLKIIESNQSANILDFGAGNPSDKELFENVLRMEFVHYKSTDVVSTERNFPFKDGVFDFVISESVFEHVRDPFHYAKEILRVLKTGGLVVIDTAFLQPVHADPFHFYNMTLEGLREVFKDFKEIEAGVESYQSASDTMNILLRTYKDLINNETIKREFSEKYVTDFKLFDKYISQDRQYIMSAGVYYVGRKTE